MSDARFALLLSLGLAPVAEAVDDGVDAVDVVDAARVEAAIADATSWLIENQRPSGAWGSHHSPRPIEVLASIPGSQDAFRVATTGLVISALLDTDDHTGVDGEAREAAIGRGLDYLLEGHYDVKRQSGLEHYNVWSFGYVLQAFGERLVAAPEDRRADALRAACEHLVAKLAGYQCLDGGWGYLSIQGYETHPPAATSMSFTTATILVGLERAQRAGIEVPQKMLERALASVRRTRLPDGAFTYGELWNRMPVAGINRHAGAACRVPACQYALERFGDEIAETDHVRSLSDLLVKHARFQRLGLRRPIPHEAWYQISGYFYLYGHAYAAYVLEEREPEVRRRFARSMAEAVLACREPDGAFWDYPLYSYHKPYGTAYALIALTRVVGELE